MNIETLAIQHFKCPSCGARPKQFCRTFKPTRSTEGRVYGTNHVHGPRVAVLREVWWDGVAQGQANSKLSPKNGKVKVNA